MRKRLLRLAGTPLMLTTASFAAVVVPGAVLGGAHTPGAAGHGHHAVHGGRGRACPASKGDGVTADYRTGYDPRSGQYVVTGVDLSGLPACTGTVNVTLLDAGGRRIGNGSLRLAGAHRRLVVPVRRPVAAERAARVSVVVQS